MEEQKTQWEPCGKADVDPNEELQRLMADAGFGLTPEELGPVQPESNLSQIPHDYDFGRLERSVLASVEAAEAEADDVRRCMPDEDDEEEEDAPREVFRVGHRVWNVSAIWKWVGDRQPNETVDVKSAERMMNIATINKHHARTVDLTRPLLTVYFPQACALMVMDGWHRVYKASQDGVETLPAHRLTPDELAQFEIVE